ncbi:MAG: hypothetical protein AAF489_07665 [Bacteroidota bacterium]
MKKKLFIYPCFALICFLVSCGNSDGEKRTSVDTSNYKTETLEDDFQISIPKEMKKASQLNQDAAMQFENKIDNSYLAIIKEDRFDFLEAYGAAGVLDNNLSDIGNYRKIQVDFFVKRLVLLEESEPDALTINDRKAEQVEFTCQVPNANSNIFYVMTFVEGEDELYMIISWTVSLLKEEHKESFYAIANSFKEL